MTDWFARAFGEAVADVRREVIERGWFGQAEPRRFESLDGEARDKPGANRGDERADLGWIDAEFSPVDPLGRVLPALDHDSEPFKLEPPAPDRTIDR